MNRVIKFRAVDKYGQWAYFGVFSTYEDLVDVKTLGQWTGLTDKNGKEIFEGDIVQVFYAGSEQTENDKAYTVTVNDIRDGFSGVGGGKGEIIGNIYENVELLTPNKEV